MSPLVGVQEDPHGRPHEARATGTAADDSVRHILRYLRGVEGEREPKPLLLEIVGHPQPLPQMLRGDLWVMPLLDQPLADQIDAVFVRGAAIVLQPVRGKETAEHGILLLSGENRRRLGRNYGKRTVARTAARTWQTRRIYCGRNITRDSP